MNPLIFPGLPRPHQLYIAPFDATKCAKKNCYFCEIMFGEKPVNPLIRISPRTKQPMKEMVKWEQWEIDLIKSNIDRTYHILHLPRHTELAVKSRKSLIRKEMGLPDLRSNYLQ